MRFSITLDERICKLCKESKDKKQKENPIIVFTDNFRPADHIALEHPKVIRKCFKRIALKTFKDGRWINESKR